MFQLFGPKDNRWEPPNISESTCTPPVRWHRCLQNISYLPIQILWAVIAVPTKATLSEIRVFLDDHSDYSLQHSSTVYYMELVNENPDCTEIMSLVAEDLLAKFDKVQDGCRLSPDHFLAGKIKL